VTWCSAAARHHQRRPVFPSAPSSPISIANFLDSRRYRRRKFRKTLMGGQQREDEHRLAQQHFRSICANSPRVRSSPSSLPPSPGDLTAAWRRLRTTPSPSLSCSARCSHPSPCSLFSPQFASESAREDGPSAAAGATPPPIRRRVHTGIPQHTLSSQRSRTSSSVFNLFRTQLRGRQAAAASRRSCTRSSSQVMRTKELEKKGQAAVIAMRRLRSKFYSSATDTHIASA
jgi:hypothetical protein